MSVLSTSGTDICTGSESFLVRYWVHLNLAGPKRDLQRATFNHPVIGAGFRSAWICGLMVLSGGLFDEGLAAEVWSWK